MGGILFIFFMLILYNFYGSNFDNYDKTVITVSENCKIWPKQHSKGKYKHLNVSYTCDIHDDKFFNCDTYKYNYPKGSLHKLYIYKSNPKNCVSKSYINSYKFWMYFFLIILLFLLIKSLIKFLSTNTKKNNQLKGEIPLANVV